MTAEDFVRAILSCIHDNGVLNAARCNIAGKGIQLCLIVPARIDLAFFWRNTKLLARQKANVFLLDCELFRCVIQKPAGIAVERCADSSKLITCHLQLHSFRLVCEISNLDISWAYFWRYPSWISGHEQISNLDIFSPRSTVHFRGRADTPDILPRSCRSQWQDCCLS